MTSTHTTAERPLATSLVEELTTALADGVVIADPDVLDAYAHDYAPICPHGTAAALVRARSTTDVAATVRIAARHGAAVVPQGARTGLAGAANAVDGCVLLSMERMTEILEIDATDMTATVQPGVLNLQLSRAVGEHGLFYPPDPSSWEWSTLGGNVATNAGGLCCVKYGVTADYVRALEVVLADGRVVRTGRRTAKGVAGYDLTHLFVGSEGTLGVITEITVSLVPAGAAPLTAVAFFPDEAEACETVTEYLATGTVPSMLELMDRTSIRLVQADRDLGFPDDVGAMLLVQSDRGGELAVADLQLFASLAEARGADVMVAEDEAEAGLLLEARRHLAIAIEKYSAFLSEDVCVPRSRLVELLAGVEAIRQRHGLEMTCAGHVGDGNMHPTVLFDPSDPGQVERARLAFDDVMRLGLDCGGTITGEHGVGIMKAEWLERELGEVALELHHRVKDALDPHGVFNPGKVLPHRTRT